MARKQIHQGESFRRNCPFIPFPSITFVRFDCGDHCRFLSHKTINNNIMDGRESSLTKVYEAFFSFTTPLPKNGF